MNRESPLPFLFFLFGVSLLVWVFSGCVSVRQNRRDVREAEVRAYEKARKIAHYQKCDDAVAIISGKIDVLEMGGDGGR